MKSMMAWLQASKSVTRWVGLAWSIALKHDDVRNQNKAGTRCTVGLIRGPLSDNSAIIRKSFSVPNAL